MSFKNHVDAKPCHCCKKVWEWTEQFNAKKRKGNQQQINKMCLRDLSQKNLLWKIHAIKRFLENLCLLIVKNNSSIHFVENIYLIKPLALHLCPRINFPSKK
jgi:hypothetical protein